MNKFKSYKVSNSNKSKKKIWRYFLCMFLILLLIGLCIYLKPYKEINYYMSDGQSTNQIESEKVLCHSLVYSYSSYFYSNKLSYFIQHWYAQIMSNFDIMRWCWEYTSYYQNWQIKEHGYRLDEQPLFETDYNDYVSYYENWQIQEEAKYKLEETEMDFPVAWKEKQKLVHLVWETINFSSYYENGQVKGVGKFDGDSTVFTWYNENGEIDRIMKRDANWKHYYDKNWNLIFEDSN